MRYKAAAVLVCLVGLSSNVTAAPECAMGSDFEHIGDKRTTIYSSQTGVAALYFRSNLDVNTDGSPRSYHPDDPWATKRLAYNNMANALTDVRAMGRTEPAGGVQAACPMTLSR